LANASYPADDETLLPSPASGQTPSGIAERMSDSVTDLVAPARPEQEETVAPRLPPGSANVVEVTETIPPTSQPHVRPQAFHEDLATEPMNPSVAGIPSHDETILPPSVPPSEHTVPGSAFSVAPTSLITEAHEADDDATEAHEPDDDDPSPP